MAQSAVPPAGTSPQARPAPAPLRVPIREILPWAVFAVVLGAVLIYFVGAEQGATSLFGGTWVHEFTHDGRHLLGFPCH
ncbi:CbtB domain-containing protein [Actinomadura fibrosa]|uniref:CbtB domain-containing protein n=1 Tax=Actinomadura fibrosa TaxID=111802 RepID=A0ABW2XYH5_9ACTN|nr:CbtB domain-containing protein [Actinomadura fibrosa]